MAPLSAYALVGKRECDPLPIVHNFGNRPFSFDPPLGYFHGFCPSGDCDADGDAINDMEDAFPTDPLESLDSDADGIGNNTDPDDDNDGVPDLSDALPMNAAETLDTDADGIGNNADPDDDNDGVADSEDAFPLDPSESTDTDNDGVGNNSDTDDDGDGLSDSEELELGIDPLKSDTDGDGVEDSLDESHVLIDGVFPNFTFTVIRTGSKYRALRYPADLPKWLPYRTLGSNDRRRHCCL